MTRRQALALADEHLSGSPWVATHATRDRGVWVVSPTDPANPAATLDGGGLVVLDDGRVLPLSSAPGSFESLLRELGAG